MCRRASAESAGVSNSSSARISPLKVVKPTCERRTPKFTPTKKSLSLSNDKPIGGRPCRRFVSDAVLSAVSRKIPAAIRGLKMSVTVLRLMPSRRANSIREIGCVARTSRSSIRAVLAGISVSILVVVVIIRPPRKSLIRNSQFFKC